MATITAVKPSYLLSIDQTAFNKILLANPAVAHQIVNTGQKSAQPIPHPGRFVVLLQSAGQSRADCNKI